MGEEGLVDLRMLNNDTLDCDRIWEKDYRLTARATSISWGESAVMTLTERSAIASMEMSASNQHHITIIWSK